MGVSIEDALQGAIGAQTRIFLVKVVSLRYLTQGRLVCWSEYLGNITVIVGPHRWFLINDYIFVTRAASEEKYQPYIYVGFASNADGKQPGSMLLYNHAGAVATPDLLPNQQGGARVGEIRRVGANVDPLTGQPIGGQLYVYTDPGTGVFQWVSLAGSASAPRQFVWFLADAVDSGPSGAVVKLDVDSVPIEVVLHAQTAPVANATIDIELSPDLTAWSSIFGVQPSIASGQFVGGSGATFAVNLLPKNAWLRVRAVVPAGLANVTVQIWTSP